MKYLLLISFVLIFISCTKEEIKPKKIYYNTAEFEPEDLSKFQDTTSAPLGK